MAQLLRPDPASFDALSDESVARWAEFPTFDEPVFPGFVGLELEEVRRDYARMRLPWRSELRQPAGVMHGGAIATLIDTVVVPAVASAYERTPVMLTIDLSLSFLGAISGEDAIAEGWITKRGHKIVFCEAVVHTSSGEPAARASLTYRVKPL